MQKSRPRHRCELRGQESKGGQWHSAAEAIGQVIEHARDVHDAGLDGQGLLPTQEGRQDRSKASGGGQSRQTGRLGCTDNVDQLAGQEKEGKRHARQGRDHRVNGPVRHEHGKA